MRSVLLWFFFLLLLSDSMMAGEHFDFRKTKYGGMPKTSVNWAKQIKQGFNMKLWLSNQAAMGREAFDNTLPPDDLGLEYPAGSNNEHLYGAGLWVGGIINMGSPGSPAPVRAVTTGHNWLGPMKEFLPEQKDSIRDRFWVTSAADSLTEPNRRGYDDDHDGMIDEDELDGIDNDHDWVQATDDLGSDGKPDSLEEGCLGAYDPVRNPDPSYDNYEPSKFDYCHPEATGIPRKNNKDKQTQGNGIPDHGEPHVDEDYSAISDKDIYCSYTDTFRLPVILDHIPLGIKVWQRSYAWRGDFADGILPIDYYIVNVGKRTINNVYVGFLTDMDVGPLNIADYWTHDYAGYYADLRTAYENNARDRGATPLGITVLNTNKSLDSLNYVFQWSDIDLTPSIDSIRYGWLTCESFGGQCIKPNGSATQPADMCVFFGFGPFASLQPGDTLKVSTAFIAGEGLDKGPNNLKDNAEKALKLYKRGYISPIIPPSPKLTIEPGYKKVNIRWGGSVGGIDPLSIWDDSNKIAESFPPDHWRRSNPPVGHSRGGRIFEGYRLYRSEDPAGSLKSFSLIKQFDLPDDNFEYNVGLDSFFLDTNLVRGKVYWYAVTSFGIPDMTILEIPDSNGLRHDTLFSENTESSLLENATKINLPFSVSGHLGEVLVVPNPYRVDNDYTLESGGWEGRARDWTENERRIKFIHLPDKCTIRVFSLSGDLVTTIEHDDPTRGEVEWNLLSESNRALASGVYIFTVESGLGRQIGKFVLIR